MPDIAFKCLKCGELVTANEKDAGQNGECPTCGEAIVVPGGKGSRTAGAGGPPVSTPSAKNAAGIVTAGWICWAVGMVLLCVLLIIPFYAPLFIASFVLGIIAITRKRTGAGVALILVSVLVPPIAALVVVAAVAGTVIQEITKPVSWRPSPPPAAVVRTPPSPRQATPQPLPSSQTLEEMSLDRFLTELDAAAKAIRSADTTARKDELRNRAKEWARQELSTKRLTLNCPIRDVRIPRDGVAEVSFVSPDLGAYGTNKARNLSLIFPGKVTLKMPKEEALKISTHQRLQMTGPVEFDPAGGDPLANLFPGQDYLLLVSVLGDIPRLGIVRFKDAKCDVLPSGQ